MRAYLDELLADKRKPSLLQQKGLPRKEDKWSSMKRRRTFTPLSKCIPGTGPGVLHAITNTLFELSISIQLAKISTPGAQVADIFYVTDLSGNKLIDAEAHENIREKLLACLASTS